MSYKPLTIIESPYHGDIEQNTLYLKRCLRDSWTLGEHPFASHGFYPLFLDESQFRERKAGIQLGYIMWDFACKVVFYMDYGMSPGMQLALEHADMLRMPASRRFIGKNPE